MLYLVKGTTPAAETILRDGHARNSTELTRQVGHTRISSAVSYFGGSKTSVVEQFLDIFYFLTDKVIFYSAPLDR